MALSTTGTITCRSETYRGGLSMSLAGYVQQAIISSAHALRDYTASNIAPFVLGAGQAADILNAWAYH